MLPPSRNKVEGWIRAVGLVFATCAIKKGNSGQLGGRNNEYKGTECLRAGHIHPHKFCIMAGGERFVMNKRWERRMEAQVRPRYCHQPFLPRRSCADEWHV